MGRKGEEGFNSCERGNGWEEGKKKNHEHHQGGERKRKTL